MGKATEKKMSFETDYWRNLSASHTCGDFYPGGDYDEYPARAENVFLTVMATLAALNLVIPLGGIIWSCGRFWVVENLYKVKSLLNQQFHHPEQSQFMQNQRQVL